MAKAQDDGSASGMARTEPRVVGESSEMSSYRRHAGHDYQRGGGHCGHYVRNVLIVHYLAGFRSIVRLWAACGRAGEQERTDGETQVSAHSTRGGWSRAWDSNPPDACATSGFQARHR